MAPEVARGEAVDPRSDLFSLGSVLYAMATGEAPFGGESAVAVLRRVSDDPARPIRELNPEAPDWLVAMIGRLMAKDPAARPQTAAEVAELLGRKLSELQLRESEPEAAPTAPAKDPTRARGEGVAKLAAIALVALASLLGLAAWSGRLPFGPPGPATVAPSRPSPSTILAASKSVQDGEKAAAKGDDRRAVERYTEALRLDAASVPALVGRGTSWWRLKSKTRALADLDEAIRREPTNALALQARAWVEVESGDYERAVKDADAALEVDPDREYAYHHRGMANNGLRRWGRAVADLSEFIRRSPGEPWSHFHRSTAYQNLGQLGPALADATKAIELSPKTPHYHARRRPGPRRAGGPRPRPGQPRRGGATRPG